jgi:LacI family transcriptional regulator
MKTVAILFVDIRVSHYTKTAYTIEREFSKRSCNVIVCNAGGELTETRSYARSIAQKQVDGVVLVGSVTMKPELVAGDSARQVLLTCFAIL